MTDYPYSRRVCYSFIDIGNLDADANIEYSRLPITSPLESFHTRMQSRLERSAVIRLARVPIMLTDGARRSKKQK
jgi:hypothetical protein